jgi:hypothetical protein
LVSLAKQRNFRRGGVDDSDRPVLTGLVSGVIGNGIDKLIGTRDINSHFTLYADLGGEVSVPVVQCGHPWVNPRNARLVNHGLRTARLKTGRKEIRVILLEGQAESDEGCGNPGKGG